MLVGNFFVHNVLGGLLKNFSSFFVQNKTDCVILLKAILNTKPKRKMKKQITFETAEKMMEETRLADLVDIGNLNSYKLTIADIVANGDISTKELYKRMNKTVPAYIDLVINEMIYFGYLARDEKKVLMQGYRFKSSIVPAEPSWSDVSEIC